MEKTLVSPPSHEEDSSLDASLPNLPFDLVEEILARLPVKFLLQFRCVCKSWNSLINDNSKFAKKHLCFSRTNRRLLLNTIAHSENTIPAKFILEYYPIKSTFATTTRNTATRLHYPPNGEFPFNHDTKKDPLIGSCDGILCLACKCHENFVVLWNPSTRKSKELPYFEKPNVLSHRFTSYGFGYDSLSDNYKVVVVIYYPIPIGDTRIIVNDWIYETQVKVHCLGTNFWRKIQEFPRASAPIWESSGKFVCGKLNWLASDGKINSKQCSIVSLDLGNETYEEVLQPDYGEEADVSYLLIMGVLNDCLSILSRNVVWVMKEYGNKESWTKMFTLPDIEELGFTKAIYIFEDHQLLLGGYGFEYTDDEEEYGEELVVYDSKNGSVKRHMVHLNNTSQVSVESLISP